MVKRFSKNYGNKGINYLQSESYIKMPVSLMLHPYIPTSLPPEPSSILYCLKFNSGIGH